MDIRPLTPAYAVSPQIDPADMAQIKAAGFAMVIDNRPDGEIPPSHHSDTMAAAAAEAGLDFVANPVIGGMLTMENVTAQAEAIAQAKGPILAYCASGNRSSIVWALAHAGKVGVDELIGTPAKYGYNLEGLRGQLEAMSKR